MKGIMGADIRQNSLVLAGLAGGFGPGSGLNSGWASRSAAYTPRIASRH
jgi:hypothetical protein